MNRTSIQSLSSARQPVPEENGATRCAIYTRKSTDEGLEQEFNSLDAQRESAEAYIVSQRHEGWSCLPARYDDGGFTGGNMERPALQRLLKEALQAHLSQGRPGRDAHRQRHSLHRDRRGNPDHRRFLPFRGKRGQRHHHPGIRVLRRGCGVHRRAPVRLCGQRRLPPGHQSDRRGADARIPVRSEKHPRLQQDL